MAGPGFSITELVEVCHLAWTYTIKIKNAPKEFGSFTAEVGSLGSTLRTLERVASREGSLYQRAETSDRQELHDVLKKCLKTLAELELLLLKHYPMLDKESKKQFWSRIRWTQVDPQGLRNKLGIYTSSIGIFMSTLTHSSLSRIEASTGMKDAEFTSIWTALGRELEQGGLTTLDLLNGRQDILDLAQHRGDRTFTTSIRVKGTSISPGSAVQTGPRQMSEKDEQDEKIDETSTVISNIHAEVEIQSTKRTIRRLEKEIVKLKNDLKEETDISTHAQKVVHTERQKISTMDKVFRDAFTEVLEAQGYSQIRIADLTSEFDTLLNKKSKVLDSGGPNLKTYQSVPIQYRPVQRVLRPPPTILKRLPPGPGEKKGGSMPLSQETDHVAAKRLAESIALSISTPTIPKPSTSGRPMGSSVNTSLEPAQDLEKIVAPSVHAETYSRGDSPARSAELANDTYRKRGRLIRSSSEFSQGLMDLEEVIDSDEADDRERSRQDMENKSNVETNKERTNHPAAPSKQRDSDHRSKPASVGPTSDQINPRQKVYHVGSDGQLQVLPENRTRHSATSPSRRSAQVIVINSDDDMDRDEDHNEQTGSGRTSFYKKKKAYRERPRKRPESRNRTRIIQRSESDNRTQRHSSYGSDYDVERQRKLWRSEEAIHKKEEERERERRRRIEDAMVLGKDKETKRIPESKKEVEVRKEPVSPTNVDNPNDDPELSMGCDVLEQFDFDAYLQDETQEQQRPATTTPGQQPTLYDDDLDLDLGAEDQPEEVMEKDRADHIRVLQQASPVTDVDALLKYFEEICRDDDDDDKIDKDFVE